MPVPERSTSAKQERRSPLPEAQRSLDYSSLCQLPVPRTSSTKTSFSSRPCLILDIRAHVSNHLISSRSKACSSPPCLLGQRSRRLSAHLLIEASGSPASRAAWILPETRASGRLSWLDLRAWAHDTDLKSGRILASNVASLSVGRRWVKPINA